MATITISKQVPMDGCTEPFLLIAIYAASDSKVVIISQYYLIDQCSLLVDIN